MNLVRKLAVGLCALTILGGTSAAVAGTIADAKAAGTNVDVTIEATVSSTTDLINSSSSKNFHLQDATGGITVYGTNEVIDPILAEAVEGDLVQIRGTTAVYSGLFELLDSTSVAPLELLDNYGPVGIPAPTPVTTADFQPGSTTADGLQSMLVKLSNVTFVQTGTFQGVRSYTVTDGTYNVTARVSTNDQDLVGKAIPTGAVDIVGIFNPYSGVYQLLMRRMADIVPAGSNFPPIAQGSNAVMNKDAEAITITLQAADADGGPLPLSYAIKGGSDAPAGAGPSADLPFGGTLTDPNNGDADVTTGGALDGNQVTFTPAAGASGWFRFKFTAYDGEYTGEATVNLLIQETAGLVITEVMYDPANLNPSDDRYESDWEWIEVYNPTESDVYLHSLYGTALDAAHTYNVYFDVVPAGGTKVIGLYNEQLATEWSPLSLDDVQPWDKNVGPWLSNSGDAVYLFGSSALTSNDAILLDVVAYKNGANNWPAANGRGSIFLEYDQLDPVANDDGANWNLSIAGANGVYATPETLGWPADSDEGSPAILPSGPTVVLTPPTAYGQQLVINDNAGTIAITLVATDPDEDPISFVIETLVEGLAPTTGSGGTLSDPNGGVISSVPYTLANNGNQVNFVPTASGVFTFGLRAHDGTSYSNYNYITFYIQKSTPTVVISEIMYDSGHAPDESDWEWIELHNPTESAVALHSLWDSDRWSTGNLTGVTIPANSTRILVRTAGAGGRTLADFLTEWAPLESGSVIEVNRDVMPYFNNDVDTLYIVGADGSLLDIVDYKDTGEWPGDNNSASIYVKHDYLSPIDNDAGGNWDLSLAGYEAAYTSASGSDVGSPGIPAPGTGYPPTPRSSRIGVLMDTTTAVSLEVADEGLPAGTLSCTIKSLPTHGSIADPGTNPPTVILAFPYTLVNNGRQVLYTPYGGYSSTVSNGDDGFSFSVSNAAGSSPDTATVTLVVQKGGLVISEIMYNPNNLQDKDWEWIEVVNTSGADIVLLMMTDDDNEPDSYVVVNELIPAGAVRVITSADNDSRTSAQFLQEWAPLATATVLFKGDSTTWENLGNSGDRVQVIDNTGALLDDVLYSNTGDWPDDDGLASIYVVEDKLDVLDNDKAVSWALSQEGVDNAYKTPTTANGGATDNTDIGSPGLLPGVTSVTLVSAKSRKNHGFAGDFDIELPLDGTPGIEMRAGGSTKIILAFSGPVDLSCSDLTIANGSCTSIEGSGSAEITVNIDSVVDATYLTLTISSLGGGSQLDGDNNVRVGNLYADATFDGGVDVSDLTAIKVNKFQTLSQANFTCDVTADGGVDVSDLTAIKVNKFHFLP